MVRLFSPRGGEGNKVLPEESIKPVTFDQTGNFRVAGLDEQAASALRGVVSSLRTGGAEAMRAAGERGLVTDWPSGNPLLLHLLQGGGGARVGRPRLFSSGDLWWRARGLVVVGGRGGAGGRG